MHPSQAVTTLPAIPPGWESDYCIVARNRLGVIQRCIHVGDRAQQYCRDQRCPVSERIMAAVAAREENDHA